MKYCINVHGTFDAKAAWIAEDSQLSRAVCEATECTIIPFRWSGGNSREDRVAAAASLRGIINGLKTEMPQCSISIVGHSHGGNIIRYALDTATGKLVDRAIFLGTPFINSTPLNLRSIRKTLKVAMVISIILSFVFSCSLMGRASASEPVDSLLQQLDDGIKTIAAVVRLLLLFFAVTFALPAMLVLGATGSLRSGQRKLLRLVRPATRARTHDFVFYVRRDEATIWLRVVDLASNFLSKFSQHLNLTLVAALRLHRTHLIAIGIGLCCGLMAVILDRPNLFAATIIAISSYGLLTTTIMSCAALVPLLSLAGGVLSLLMRGTRYAYGWEGLSSYIAFTTTVARVPDRVEANTCRVFRCDFAQASARWLHCKFYNDPIVCMAVATIVAGRQFQANGSIEEERLQSQAPRRRRPKLWMYAPLVYLYGCIFP